MKPRLSWAAAGDLRPGDLLACVEAPPVTMTQLAFYCGAVGVTDPIHYDREFAKRMGFPDAVVNGSLRVAWLAQAVTNLIAEPDRLDRLQCSHRGMMVVGQAPRIEIRFKEQRRHDDHIVLVCTVENHVESAVVDVADAEILLMAGAAPRADRPAPP
jgi:acyl dehydratase